MKGAKGFRVWVSGLARVLMSMHGGWAQGCKPTPQTPNPITLRLRLVGLTVLEFWLQDWKVGGFQEYTVRGYGTPPSPPRDGIQFNEPIYPNKLACIYIYMYTHKYIYI